jgi:hypothetical protein
VVALRNVAVCRGFSQVYITYIIEHRPVVGQFGRQPGVAYAQWTIPNALSSAVSA